MASTRANTPQVSNKIDPWGPRIQAIVQSIQETPVNNLQAAVSDCIPFDLQPSVDKLSVCWPASRHLQGLSESPPAQ
jgi:hypothetical protein